MKKQNTLKESVDLLKFIKLGQAVHNRIFKDKEALSVGDRISWCIKMTANSGKS